MIASGGPRNSTPGTINRVFFDAVAKYRKPDALQVKRNGRYEPISHDTLMERVRRTALGGTPLPDERARRRLAQVHLGHRELVRPNGAACKQQQCGHRQPCSPADHGADSSVTRYFLAIERTTPVRCSAIVVSVQSCSTTPRRVSNFAGSGGVLPVS